MAILLVDDDPRLTGAIARNLKKEEWEILTATSGTEALNILKDRADVEILATDFNMPGMDGAELINHALAFQPDLYTIVFTGWTDREYAVRALRVGTDDFIDKKSDIDDELRHSIHRGFQQLALARMGRELLLQKDEQEILEQVLDSLGALNRFGGVCLATRELGSSDCKVECAVDLKTRENVGGLGVLGPGSAYRFVIEQSNNYFPPLIPEGTVLRPFLPDTRSIIIVPLIFRSYERGALGIEHREAGRFKIDDLKFLRRAADLISMAMEKLTNLDRVELEESRSRRERGLLARALLHELKNPLNNLSTAVDVVMDTVESEELDDLYDNIRRIDSVVDHFLKPLIEGEKDPEPLDVSRTLGEAITRVRAYDPHGTASIHYEIPSTIPRLKGSEEMLIAAFVNLLENATKAAGPDGKISVHAIHVPVRDQIEITIRDDGPGIPTEDLANIFDYGYTTRDKGHFGYGLGLTRDIVQVHGGEITVESTEGEGAAFKLSFPSLCEQEDRRTPAATGESAA